MHNQAEIISDLRSFTPITREKLSYLAFNGDRNSVYSFYKKLNDKSRFLLSDKYVFSEVIDESIQKIQALEKLHNESAIDLEKKFLLHTSDLFIEYCETNADFPREFYNSLIKVAELLTHLSEFQKSLLYLNYLLKHNVNKFPELRLMTYFRIAFINNIEGDLEKAYLNFCEIIEHPYLINDKSKFADLLFKLSHTSLKLGNTHQYKKLLFLGLRFFYTNADDRKRFFDQLKLTYRSSFLLLANNEVSFYNKFLFAIHWSFYKRPNFYKIKLGFLSKIIEKVFLGIIYLLNYARGGESIKMFREINSRFNLTLAINNNNFSKSAENSHRKKILITRAMGGIGDLLMMTPGIHALKSKYPEHQIHLAIPKRYFSVFQENDDVNLIDIEEDFFSHYDYKKWYNFTDCPAAREESRTAPKVKKSRIRIFANALGVRHFRYLLMNKNPRYFLNQSEIIFANDFFVQNELQNQIVIGVQLHSDETYRDFPLMDQLVRKISKDFKVLVFDNKSIDGYNINNVIKVQSLPIRNAFALVSKCNLIIAPDSSFIHLAAAFNLPTIALFGPIDGKVRTKHYENCTYLNSKDSFGCLPCWRNESIPCKLTGMRHSECLSNISLDKILIEINHKLNKKNFNDYSK